MSPYSMFRIRIREVSEGLTNGCVLGLAGAVRARFRR